MNKCLIFIVNALRYTYGYSSLRNACFCSMYVLIFSKNDGMYVKDFLITYLAIRHSSFVRSIYEWRRHQMGLLLRKIDTLCNHVLAYIAFL